jgi:hypothetical protein
MSPARWGVEATEFNSSDPSTIQHRGHLLLVSSLLCTLEAAAQGLHLTLQGVNLQRLGSSNDAMLLGVRHVCSQVPEKRCDKNLEMLKYVETGGKKSGEPPQFNCKLG